MGGIVLASGDAFLLVQQAGVATTFSFTATADLIILNYGFDNASTIRLGTYVGSTSGVYNYGMPMSLGAASTYQNGQAGKLVLTSGNTITCSNANINAYGFCAGGIEI